VQTPPILVIGTTYDPATPDAWARSLAEKLGVGVYINYNSDGHTAYMSGSTELNRAVDAFFMEGKVPAAGTSYDPDWPMLD
jgi:pimeloyl-ACP methyl ester carboxylesterase